MFRSASFVVLCAVVIAACGGGSSTSPGGSDPAINAIHSSGNWTGTLTRPGGAAFAVAWTPTQATDQSTGPATFTLGNVVMKGTITFRIGGTVDSPIYSVSLAVDAGTAGSTLPNCKFSGQAGNGTPVVANGGKKIDAALSNMSYVACPELVGGAFVQESNQLSVVQQ